MRSHFSGNSCFLHASMTPRKRVWSMIDSQGKPREGREVTLLEIWVISFLPIWKWRIWTQITQKKIAQICNVYSVYFLFKLHWCISVCVSMWMPHHRRRGQRTTCRGRFLSSTKRVLRIQFRSSAMSLSTESLLQPQYSFYGPISGMHVKIARIHA